MGLIECCAGQSFVLLPFPLCEGQNRTPYILCNCYSCFIHVHLCVYVYTHIYTNFTLSLLTTVAAAANVEVFETQLSSWRSVTLAIIETHAESQE